MLVATTTRSAIPPGDEESVASVMSTTATETNDNDNDGDGDDATHDAYLLVIDRIKAVHETPLNSDSGAVDPDILRQRLEEAFDESFVRYATGEEESAPMDRESMIRELQEMAAQFPHFRLVFFRHKPAEDELNCIQVYLRFGSDDHHMIKAGKWYYNPQNAKIIRSETVRTMCKKVAGEMSTGPVQLTPSLTEGEFARKGRAPAPQRKNKKVHVNDSAAIMGATNVSDHMIRVFMSQCSNLWQETVQKNDKIVQIVLSDSKGEAYAGGAYFRNNKRRRGNVRTWTLFDRKDRPVALCKRQDDGFTVCGTKPLIPGAGQHQYSRATMEEVMVDDAGRTRIMGFYPWFRMRAQTAATSTGKRVAYVYILSKTGRGNQQVDFEPIYKILSTASSIPTTSSTSSSEDSSAEQGGSRQDLVRVQDYYTCQTAGVIQNELRIHKKWHQQCDFMDENPDLFHRGVRHHCRTSQVDIATGRDPIIFLCIAACLEEMWV